VKVEIRRVTAPLRGPWRFSGGEIRERELLLLALQDDHGRVGLGEAAPLASYDGVTIRDVQDALGDCLDLLREAGAEEAARGEIVAQCARRAVLPQAVAAVDLALWDLAGQRAQVPVWRLLGADLAPAVEVNYSISATDRAGAASQGGQAREQGYRCVKAKVGVGDDPGRLAALRAATGPQMALRIDANGVWSLDEARAALQVLEPLRLELCEQPVRGLEEMALLSELTSIPLSLDEGATAPGALDRRVCAAVCLKIARCGGISGLIGAAQHARSSGYEVYLASTLDGPLGIAGALHAAAVISPDRPSGLATLGLFAGRQDPLPARDGRISVPEGPGLGSELHRWYQA
jgi:L-Ala-D/L-Glu epimerase